MKREDKDFLATLQNELKEQNDKYKLGLADPIYIGIRDYRWVYTDDDAEEYHVIANCENEYTLEEFAEELWKHYKVGLDENEEQYTQEKLTDVIASYNYTEELRYFLKSTVLDADPNDFIIVGVREEAYIVDNEMFLTIKEAYEHLQANKHHYSEKAHPYAMTAWRSPEYARLVEIIKNTNWEEL